MVTTTVTIKAEAGLHARPAAQLVALCGGFQSRIILRHGDVTAEAKSIISVLAAGIKRGTTVTLTADGPDAASAAKAVAVFLAGL